MMKQVLLSVPAMLTKVSFGKFAQALRRHFLSTREILLCQHALDPNIDGEGAQATVSKKQHAVGNLFPHARQLQQERPRGDIIELVDSTQINFAGRDHPRGAQKVFRPIAQSARPQPPFFPLHRAVPR